MAAPTHHRRGRRGRAACTRADWRKLVTLAIACAADAEGEAADDDARLRLMTLGRSSVSADAGVFRPAGAATLDVAAGVLRIVKAFARPETPGAMRRRLAPPMATGAAFLEATLHEMATADFQAAHRGRPEVWN